MGGACQKGGLLCGFLEGKPAMSLKDYSPPPAALVGFHLTPFLVQSLTRNPPQGPPAQMQSFFEKPRLHPSGVARGQVGPGGQGNLAASHRDLESVPALLSAPNLAFHGEPLQGSWGQSGCLLAPPRRERLISTSNSLRVNEPLSTFHLSECCQALWSSAVSLLFSLSL